MTFHKISTPASLDANQNTDIAFGNVLSFLTVCNNQPDWTQMSNQVIDEIRTQYESYGLGPDQIAALRMRLEEVLFGQNGKSGFVTNGSLIDSVTYAIQNDPILMERVRNGTGAQEGEMVELSEEQVLEYTHETVAMTLQSLAELVAISQTGIMPPDRGYMDARNTYLISEGEQPHDDAYFTQQRLNVPLRVPQRTRDEIDMGIYKILNGDILLTTLTTNRYAQHGAATIPAYAGSNTARKYDGSGPIPVIEMYVNEGYGTTDLSDDTRMIGIYGPGVSSSDALTLMHELDHALDDTDGTPITEPGEENNGLPSVQRDFLTEYSAYYKGALNASFDRREKHRLLQNTKNDIEDFACDADGVYKSINTRYQTDPSFRTRVDLILHALADHKDITPELAEQIIMADSDAAAEAIVDAVPEAINTCPDNPVCD